MKKSSKDYQLNEKTQKDEYFQILVKEKDRVLNQVKNEHRLSNLSKARKAQKKAIALMKSLWKKLYEKQNSEKPRCEKEERQGQKEQN